MGGYLPGVWTVTRFAVTNHDSRTTTHELDHAIQPDPEPAAANV